MLQEVLQKIGFGKKEKITDRPSEAERLFAGISARCFVHGTDDYSGNTNVYYYDSRLNIENAKIQGKFRRTSPVVSVQGDGTGGYFFVTSHSCYRIKPLS